jgi:hypothetical protein
VVNDFCEAWRAHDVTKIMSYFADNCAYRPLETMEAAKGREAVQNEIKRFVNNVDRFEMLETWARGPMVINQRIDHFTGFPDGATLSRGRRRKRAVPLSLRLSPILTSQVILTRTNRRLITEEQRNEHED